MILHKDIAKGELGPLIRSGEIALGGNIKASIFGTLECKQGMRLDRDNRVFFRSEEEARAAGYRPCGSCMHAAHQEWDANRKK